MEIIDGNPTPEPKPSAKRDNNTVAGNIYLGVLLIAIGAIWMFNNFGFISYRFFDVLFSWQMLLVVIGGYLLAVKRYTAGSIVGGLGLLFVLMDVLNIYVSVSKVILPAVVIALGLSLLLSQSRK